jgi:hypothetical protein
MLEKQQTRKDKQEQAMQRSSNIDMVILKFVPADNFTSDYIRSLPTQASNPWLTFVAPMRPKNEDQKRERSINDIIRYLATRWHLKKRFISLKLLKFPREVVKDESFKNLTKFTYPCPFKVTDLHSLYARGKRSELIFLY